MKLIKRMIGACGANRPRGCTAPAGIHRGMAEEHLAALVLAATGLPVGPGVAACARAAGAALASLLATGRLTPRRRGTR